jgi:hypothetical protein
MKIAPITVKAALKQVRAWHRHCISSAAALTNWHAALLGVNTSMRPGILPPKEFP